MSEYISGEWNVICDRCSTEIKASEAQHEWTGFIVCKDCWEPRHPMDFIKARSDKISVPFTRPEPVDNFTGLDISGNAIPPTYIYTPDAPPEGTFDNAI